MNVYFGGALFALHEFSIEGHSFRVNERSPGGEAAEFAALQPDFVA